MNTTIFTRKSSSGFGLIEFGILIIILVVMILLAIPLYRDFTIAQKVAASFPVTTDIEFLVSKNAVAGLNYDAGWTPPPATAEIDSININRENGEITVNFAQEAGNGSLVLVPLLNGNVLSGGTDTSSSAIGEAVLTWNCNSAAAAESQLGSHGTLAGKYALIVCH